MAWCVYDIDSVTFPKACGSGRSDGNTSLLLLSHPVHSGGTIVGLAHLMVNASIEKDSFGCGRFSGINMCHYSNVSC